MATDTRAAVARPETVPSLIQMLFGKYEKKAAELGEPMSVPTFVAFSEGYLSSARPESAFVVPDNMGIALTSGDIVLVCPHNASAGDMASSVPAIQI